MCLLIHCFIDKIMYKDFQINFKVESLKSNYPYYRTIKDNERLIDFSSAQLTQVFPAIY